MFFRREDEGCGVHCRCKNGERAGETLETGCADVVGAGRGDCVREGKESWDGDEGGGY